MTLSPCRACGTSHADCIEIEREFSDGLGCCETCDHPVLDDLEDAEE